MALIKFFKSDNLKPVIKSKIAWHKVSHAPHKSDVFCKTINSQFNTIPDLPKIKTFPKGLISYLSRKKILKDETLIRLVEHFPENISAKDYDYFIQHRIKLTKYDDDYILNMRKSLRNNNVLPSDESYTELTREAHQIELEKLSNVPSDRKMVIVTGLAGSGKSTYIKQNGLDKDYYIADVDIIKRLLNGDETDQANLNFHNLSQHILQKGLIPEIFNKGKNIVLPTTGMMEYIDRLAVAAKNNGYNVSIVHINTELHSCVERALLRNKTLDKFTDPLFIYKRTKANKNLIAQLKKSDLVDSLSIYENNAEGLRIIYNNKKPVNIL